MDYRIAAVLVMIAVLTAGCTEIQPSGEEESEVRTTPSDGLTVGFQPQSSSIKENEVLQFDVEVSNTGGSEAEITSRGVFGNPFVEIGGRCDPMSRVSPGTTLNSGSAERFTWRCEAPLGGGDYDELVDLEDGATDTFSTGIELTYGYSTTATANVEVSTPSRFERSSPVTTDNSAAPVHATINLRSPQSARDGNLDVPVTVRNVGDGEVVGSVDVTVEVEGVDEPPVEDRQVSLVDGSRQFVASLPGFSLREGRLSKPVGITVEMSYSYRERISAPFTLRGQPQNVDVETRDQLGPRVPDEGEEGDEGEEPGGGREGAVTFTVTHNDDASAGSAEYKVDIRKKEEEPIKATIRQGTGFSDRCTAEVILNVAGTSATIRQSSRMQSVSGTEGESGTVEISLSDWECREDGEEPFHLGCLPTGTPSVNLDPEDEPQSATCYSGEVVYDATISFQGEPVREARVSHEGSNRKVAPAEEPPQFSLSGSDIGTTIPFTATGIEGCDDASMDVVAGERGGSVELACTDEALDRLAGKGTRKEPDIGGGTVFVVDLLNGRGDEPDVLDDHLFSTTVTKEQKGDKPWNVMKVSVGGNEDLGCRNGQPEVEVAGADPMGDAAWEGRPWLWSGTLTVNASDGALSLREVRCPDNDAVQCSSIDQTVEPSSMDRGETRTFTATCIQGPVPYDARVFQDGDDIGATVSAAGATKETGPNRDSVFEIGGADSQYDLGDTVPFTASGVSDCEETSMDVVVGGEGKSVSMTCD